MAYNVGQLRKQNLLDQYGVGSSTRYGSQAQQGGMFDDQLPGPYQDDQFSRGVPTFGGPTQPDQGVIQRERIEPVGQPDTDDDYEDPNDQVLRLMQQYTPETTDRDRLRALMDSVPQREEPGLLRRLSAFGMGLGQKDPLAVHEGVMYAPYHRDMADWTAKAEPYYKTAQLENQANTQERTLTGNLLTADAAGKRVAQQEKAANQRYEVAIDRNRIARYKAEHGPDWIVDARNGPTVMMYNKVTGEPKDTGISTRYMSEADKIEAETQGRIDVARERGAQDRQTAETRGEQTRETNRERPPQPYTNTDPQGNKSTLIWDTEKGTWVSAPGIPEGSSLTRIGTPSNAPKKTAKDVELEEQQKYRGIYNRYPQYQSKKFFKQTPDGTLIPQKRPTYGWVPTDADDADMAEWDKFNALITPDYVPPSSGNAPKSAAPAQTKPPEQYNFGPQQFAPPNSGGGNRFNAPPPDPRAGQGLSPTNTPQAPSNEPVRLKYLGDDQYYPVPPERVEEFLRSGRYVRE